MSKYRSDINNILTNSIVKNRTQSSNLLNEMDASNKYSSDVIYAGTVYNSAVSSSTSVPESKTLYCPRQSTKRAERNSIFDSIKSKFTLGSPSNVNSEEIKSSSKINPTSRISPRIAKNENVPTPTPVKELGFADKFSSFIQNRIFPFVSHLWLQFSKLLPYLVLMIFTIIALQYVSMKLMDETSHFFNLKQTFSQIKSTLSKPIFLSNDNLPNKHQQQEQQQQKTPKTEHFYCADIKDTQCAHTKVLVREVIDYLRVRSGQIDCSPLVNAQLDHEHSYPIDFIEKCVHLNQLINYLTNERKLIKTKQYFTEATESVLKAISKNPHWNLRLLNASYQDTNQLNQVTYLMSTISSKSLSCRFKELLHFLYVRVIMLISLCLTLFLGFLTYKALKVRRIEKDQKFFNLIKQVTELVEKQYELSLLDSGNIKPYIAISHVYDTLIEPSQRASKKKQWNDVIKFIEDHESRIHLETQFIDGEETLVWKWVVPKHHESVNSFKHVNLASKNEGIGLANSTMITTDQVGLNKENGGGNDVGKGNGMTVGWQGDAFNRSEKLVHSPTPCLKIRGMFDQISVESDPMFSAKIHNDILEKCSSTFNGRTVPNDSILHISCDKKSKEGCVYVKCMTNEAAGRVYQALNGTWYNGKLLNVKFLRSDRYLDRFPESVNFSNPLQSIKL